MVHSKHEMYFFLALDLRFKSVILWQLKKIGSSFFVPVAHAANSKENYETLEAVLKCIQYEKYEWKICADLKVVAILSDLLFSLSLE